jgi:hypothetical protein
MLLPRRAGKTFLVALSAALAAAAAGQKAGPPPERWFRGNTHTHSINSDGDSAPDSVVRWYKEHGYQFVVLSDHDMLTPVEGLNAALAAPGKFLVLGGEEVTDSFQGAPVHLIAINPRAVIMPQGGASIADTLNRNARAIREAGGLPHANHPNFGWAWSAPELIAAAEVRHFEIWNSHFLVNNRGGGGSLSTEEIWDAALSAGRVVYGLASDDTHHLQGEFAANRVNPGRAWVMVRAAELSPAAIVAALDSGNFYSSTGVALRDFAVTPAGIRISLPADPGRSALRYRTFFIGKGGELLKRDDSLAPAYAFRGQELYVRARIEASSGAVAWTQPVFREKLK